MKGNINNLLDDILTALEHNEHVSYTTVKYKKEIDHLYHGNFLTNKSDPSLQLHAEKTGDAYFLTAGGVKLPCGANTLNLGEWEIVSVEEQPWWQVREKVQSDLSSMSARVIFEVPVLCTVDSGKYPCLIAGYIQGETMRFITNINSHITSATPCTLDDLTKFLVTVNEPAN